MGSAAAKMTAARTIVVLATVVTAGFIAALNRLPIFRLRLDKAERWSITQSLWTTDIYTPFAEKHIPVQDFTKQCNELANAFRITQIANAAALVALALAFLCGLVHLTPQFTSTNRYVRKVCGVPICLLLLAALVATGLQGYVMKCMYEKETWCTSKDHNGTQTTMTDEVVDDRAMYIAICPPFIPKAHTPEDGPGVVVVEEPFVLAEERDAAEAVVVVEEAVLVQEQPVTVPDEVDVSIPLVEVVPPVEADNAPGMAGLLERPRKPWMRASTGADALRPFPDVVAPGILAVDTEEKKCDPFAGCIASYKDMGFSRDSGCEVVWYALYLGIFALVAEMLVVAVGASVVPQAGLAQETVALLNGDDEDRVI